MKTTTNALLLIGALFFVPAAEAEIYRCTDDNGNMMFSQFPCADDEAKEDKTEPEAVGKDPAEAGDNADVLAEMADDATVAECKKPYRDAIDAIEARLLNGHTPQQAQAYRKQLLGLTRGLRSCES